MRRKNLWLRVSSCTMAALLATTSVAPVSAAGSTDRIRHSKHRAEKRNLHCTGIPQKCI
nr:hypothetical protein [uncultured Blautia sp.]